LKAREKKRSVGLTDDRPSGILDVVKITFSKKSNGNSTTRSHKTMNNRTTLIGLGAFAACLWLVAVTTYAAQVKREGDGIKPIQVNAPSSCSSSSSSGGGE